MVQIGNVPEINQVKDVLRELQNNGLISDWELPYENILTRLDAAYFYLSLAPSAKEENVWTALSETPNFQHAPNEDKKLSQLDWEITFKKDAENNS